MPVSSRYQHPPGGETSHNLFSWEDGNPSSSSTGTQLSGHERRGGRSSVRTAVNQMGSQIVFGEMEEPGANSNNRRSMSQRKVEELAGSGIFAAGPVTTSSNAYASNNGNYITERPSVRLHQPAGGISHIVFGKDEEEVPKKVLSPLKKLELSGTSETTDDVNSRKQFSDRKIKELNGSISIFSPPPQPVPPKVRTSPTLSDSMDEMSRRGGPMPIGGVSQIVFGEVGDPEPPSRKVSEKKVRDLLGTGEYKEPSAPMVSEAKARELKGCDIFADEAPKIRDSLGGIRQPPGGESHIALV